MCEESSKHSVPTGDTSALGEWIFYHITTPPSTGLHKASSHMPHPCDMFDKAPPAAMVHEQAQLQTGKDQHGQLGRMHD